jgi:hypothetical protein
VVAVVNETVDSQGHVINDKVGTQPHEHEDPRWDCGPEACDRAMAQRERAAADIKDLRGEALRRAWLDASYRVQPEPPVWPALSRPIWGSPDAPILADWDHEDCAICAKAAAGEPARGMNIPALLLSVGFGSLLWGLIGYVAWLTWQAVA